MEEEGHWVMLLCRAETGPRRTGNGQAGAQGKGLIMWVVPQHIRLPTWRSGRLDVTASTSVVATRPVVST